MCNCGRKAPTEVVTSAQALADAQARADADAAHNAEIMQASANHALSNASTGWFAAPPDPA